MIAYETQIRPINDEPGEEIISICWKFNRILLNFKFSHILKNTKGVDRIFGVDRLYNDQ